MAEAEPFLSASSFFQSSGPVLNTDSFARSKIMRLPTLPSASLDARR